MLKENIYNFRTVLLTLTGCLHYTFVMCGPLAKHRVFFSTHTVNLKLICMPVLQNQENAVSLDVYFYSYIKMWLPIL